MKPNPAHRLPAPLEAAVQRLKLVAREATERTVESLGLASLGASGPGQRDGLLAAQFELNRKAPKFLLTFNDALDERMVRELGQPSAPPSAFGSLPRNTRWDALSLVDDREVELQIQAERCGMEIGHACEWELRELETFVATLLDDSTEERPRNPLRPEVVGHAMLRGVEAVTEEPATRKLMAAEYGRSFAALLRGTYATIIADFRRMGVQPAGMAVRNRPGAGGGGVGMDSRMGALATGSGALRDAADSGPGGPRSGFAPSRSGTGSGLGHVEPAVMALLRRLAQSDPGPSAGTGPADGLPSPESSLVGVPLSNVIRAHRDELRQASRGNLDHMVIDVIGFLFDQILADPKVAPQMARQIARLQLPVLRAAMGDPTFFSSRKHPVRRFVNRIASLGAGFEDYASAEGRAFVDKVQALVGEVVEGEFDRIEVYEAKLTELEAFVAELMRRNLPLDEAAAALLAQKEDELLLRELYAQQLEGDLREVDAPPFVREFLARVWSQVLLAAEARGPAGVEFAQRMKRAARELVLSVQPKPSPAHRKLFLAELPKLMQDLSEGMNLVAWPEMQRRAFFGQLMPAHAESLKNAAVRQLDLNLMAKRVEGALDKPAPSRELLRNAGSLPVLSEEVQEPQLTQEEARRVGLIDEAAFNWNGSIDIDLSEEAPPPAQALPPAPGLPALADAPDPTRGRALAQALEIGFAYQMYLDERWQKVRLSHVSPGRTFFMFTLGSRQRRAVSMTQRMVLRLCETGRLRAFEQASLLERATERARRQLAALGNTAVARMGSGLALPLGAVGRSA